MSRKFLVTLILILFLLPAISWYYLQSGLKWRKEAQEIMKGTQPFPAGKLMSRSGYNFDSKDLKDHVTLVSFLNCTESEDQMKTLQEIYTQFKDTRKANYILLDTCTIPNQVAQDSLKQNWFVLPCTDTILFCSQIKDQWSAGKTFALVDRDGIIRSYYSAQTMDEKRLLLEHMALLLPRERQEKVELKRGDKK